MKPSLARGEKAQNYLLLIVVNACRKMGLVRGGSGLADRKGLETQFNPAASLDPSAS